MSDLLAMIGETIGELIAGLAGDLAAEKFSTLSPVPETYHLFPCESVADDEFESIPMEDESK